MEVETVTEVEVEVELEVHAQSGHEVSEVLGARNFWSRVAAEDKGKVRRKKLALKRQACHSGQRGIFSQCFDSRGH